MNGGATHPRGMALVATARLRGLAILPALVLVAGCACPRADAVRTIAYEQAPPATMAPATTAPAAAIGLPLTAADLAGILCVDGQSAVRFDAESVVLRQGDLQLLVFLEDGGTTLQAVLPYHGVRRGHPLRVARWNATRRFGRAYLDHEDSPILASDLPLADHMPTAMVQDWSRLVLAMAAAFRDEVWPDSAPPTTPYDE